MGKITYLPRIYEGSGSLNIANDTKNIVKGVIAINGSFAPGSDVDKVEGTANDRTKKTQPYKKTTPRKP